MFNRPCFIRKNTPELREYLQELGYKNQLLYGVTNNIDYIACRNDEYFSNKSTWVEMLSYCGYIDCGANEELFKAIAALRDDSDYMQWFVCDEEDDVSNKGDFVVCRYDKLHSSNYHKATVEELIEHFK